VSSRQPPLVLLRTFCHCVPCANLYVLSRVADADAISAAIDQLEKIAILGLQNISNNSVGVTKHANGPTN
jgi:hypothetical protein